MAWQQGGVQALERLLSKLPLEEQVDAILDSAARNAAAHPLVRRLAEIHSRLPALPERDMPTPFGAVRIPEIRVPEPLPPQMDERRREVVKAAAATDLSSIVGVIPVLGDAVADVVEDVFAAKIRDTLTKEEMDLYVRYDKLGPSTLAAIRTFIRSPAGGQ